MAWREILLPHRDAGAWFAYAPGFRVCGHCLGPEPPAGPITPSIAGRTNLPQTPSRGRFRDFEQSDRLLGGAAEKISQLDSADFALIQGFQFIRERHS
jgi:hypothetical protein